ncbi:helix-turn-helix transcriptional regulator [bacterium]|nr:helix-turn-helix transcriptional regulator [bacterium]
MTREALSELVGVSAKSIQRYEEARQIPRVKTLEKLGQVLDIPVDEFFRQIESPRQRTRSRFDELAAGQREILSRLDDFLAGYHVLSARVNSLALALEKHIDTVSSRCGMGTD